MKLHELKAAEGATRAPKEKAAELVQETAPLQEEV